MQPERVKATLEEKLGKTLDPVVVSVALNAVNADEKTKKAKERVTWELWDKESPINGVDPSYVLNRSDYAGGEVYLIFVDGQLMYLQPHAPGPGLNPITSEDVDKIAGDHAQDIATRLVEDEIMSAVEEMVVAAMDSVEPTQEPVEVVQPDERVTPSNRRMVRGGGGARLRNQRDLQ